MNQHEFIEKLNMQVNILILKQILCTDQCISRGLGVGGVRARGRDLKKFLFKFPRVGNETSAPPQGKKSKQTIL